MTRIDHRRCDTGRRQRRAAVRAAAALVSIVGAVAGCQGGGSGGESTLDRIEGPDRAEGRELDAIDMSREMDDMSAAQADAAAQAIEGD